MSQTIQRHNPILLLASSLILSGVFVWFASLEVFSFALVLDVNPSQTCPQSEFTCITIAAPLDHNDGSAGETIPVTFAVLPARSGNPEGAFVTAVGGPGASGIAVADYAYPYLGSEIRDRYDIVYFDHRGVELWDQLACPDSDLENGVDYAELPTDPELRWTELSEITDEYVESCVVEMARPEILPYLGTSQAAADLEQFREEQGYDKLILYGESYGTQFAQVYATEYPDSVHRLILDGVVDLTRDGLQLNTDQLEAVDDTLAVLFETCDQDEWCSDDMRIPASQAYDSLARRLVATPTTVEFPLDKDTIEKVPFTTDDLGYLAFSSLYAEDDRMLFMRALAAYSGSGDLVPMIRLYGMGYAAGLNNAVYSAVSCNDTDFPGDDLAAESKALSAALDGVRADQRWSYERAVTCLHWPGVDREAEVPGPFTGEGIPTLVIASDGDVATPYSHALSVAANLDDGHLLTVSGGTHVMFGRDIACVDDAVIAFALDGLAPQDVCQVEPMSPYYTLLPDIWDVPPEDRITFAESEIYWFPELIGWDRLDPLTLGCNEGGEITFTGDPSGTHFDLDGCGLNQGLVVSGSGDFDYDRGESRLEVSLQDSPCTYQYEYVWDPYSETVDEVCP